MKKINSNPLYRISFTKPQKELTKQLLLFRSEAHWLVGEKEKAALFKAPVGLDPIQPPRTGWQFSKKVNFGEGRDSDANSQLSPRRESSRKIQVWCALTRWRRPAAPSPSAYVGELKMYGASMRACMRAPISSAWAERWALTINDP